MTEILAYESSQRELSNEYQHDRDEMVLKNLSLNPCALDERSLRIGRVKMVLVNDGLMIN